MSTYFLIAIVILKLEFTIGGTLYWWQMVSLRVIFVKSNVLIILVLLVLVLLALINIVLMLTYLYILFLELRLV